MTGEELRTAAQAAWDAFNAHDLSQVDEQVAADFTNANAAPGTPDGPEGMKQVNKRLWSAFPDMRFDVEEIFVSDNRVAVLGWMNGTQEGQFGPFPAGGKSFRVRQIHTMRYNDRGQVIDHIATRDDVSMLQQLGHMPSPD